MKKLSLQKLLEGIEDTRLIQLPCAITMQLSFSSTLSMLFRNCLTVMLNSTSSL